MFFGNSLTAGYGLEEGQDFPSILRRRVDSLGLEYEVINAGLSGETTSNGMERISWVLREPVDIFMLELGANDMLRGTSVKATDENLRAILDIVQEKSPEAKIVIAGMQAPPNMGADYVNVFNSIFPKLAEDYDAALIPFFLEGVAGDPSLNLPDRKHPNIEGQKIVAENVWEVIEPLL
ncbi:arylesterase [Portibacter lacus]|nr:arylesterase [Portibacter lacus]